MMLLRKGIFLALLIISQIAVSVQAGNVNQGDRVQGMAQFMNESAENIQWFWLGGIAIAVLVFLLFVRWIHHAMIRRHKPKTKVPVNKHYAPDPSARKKAAPKAQPGSKPATPGRRGKGKRRY
jgi:hypothetical protein